MNISQQELEELLAEIKRLKEENALLRRVAGITLTPATGAEQVQVTADEKEALLRKTI